MSCSLSLFSYSVKPVCCIGDGGAVFAHHDRVFLLRDQGRNDDCAFVTWEANSRRETLEFAVLPHRFKSCDNAIKKN